MSFYSHESTIIDQGASIGRGSSVWHYSHIRSTAVIGQDCVLGNSVYIDENVVIGDRCKIQNKVSVYNGVTVDNDVFIGPHVCFTNDMFPRAFNDNWQITKTHVERGVSIGANATIRCGITIGEFAMIGAGATVTKDVPAFALILGSPGQIKGQVCYCGEVINSDYSSEKVQLNDLDCPHDSNLDLSKFS